MNNFLKKLRDNPSTKIVEIENLPTQCPINEHIQQVENYFKKVMDSFKKIQLPKSSSASCPSLHEKIYQIITSRQFCYLSRTRSGAYRKNILDHIKIDIERKRPSRFYYDLGPGYHASICPKECEVDFDVGLAELFAIYQIVTFCNKIRQYYEPGAHFWLVIDNLCGLVSQRF